MKKKIKKTINILNSINLIFIEFNLVKPNQKILVALSGGQDSITILFLFFIFKNQWNLKLKTVYCNHLWQKETFYTFLHLAKISFTFKVHISYSIALIVPNSEQKSRDWRLTIYLRILNFLKDNLIATAHTQSDQIETFLFNLTRGAGIKGAYSLNKKKSFKNYTANSFIISNIHFINFKKFKKKQIIKNLTFNRKIKFIKKKKNTMDQKYIFFIKKKEYIFKKIKFKKTLLIRPLYNQSRFDIQRICNNCKLPVLPDKSNQENFYTRNRIRKQLLPTLRFFLNPQLDSTLYKYNQILIEEQKPLENIFNSIFNETIIENKKIFCLNLTIFYFLPIGIQRKICFIIFEEKLSIKSNFSSINNFIALLNIKYIKLTKNKETNKYNWFFFPKIGVLLIYKKLIIFIK